MKLFWIFLLLLTSNQLLSQGYILKKKNRVEKALDKYTKTEKPFSKKEFSNVLLYTSNDSLSLPYALMLYFDNHNRCIAEEKIFSCDSCMKNQLAYVLTRSYPKWYADEDGNYRSKFPSSTFIQTIVSNNLYILRFTYLGWKGGRYEHFVDSFNK